MKFIWSAFVLSVLVLGYADRTHGDLAFATPADADQSRPSPANSDQAMLTIVVGQQRLVFSRSQLLSRRDVQTVSIADSVYKQLFTRFRAIPLANLFSGLAIPDLAVIQCNGTDGFSAVLEKTRLLNPDTKASRPFLAIEDPEHPWPVLQGDTTSAGPFYLVWTAPKASGIGPEEWPFKIASLVVLSDTRSVFPNIYPADDAAANVQSGFKSFLKNCFPCHKMNGNGAASIGPDLNLPLNPTEYLEDAALAALIRNPASVRSWPGMVMRGFSESALSDAERSDLIAYLKTMSKMKAKQ